MMDSFSPESGQTGAAPSVSVAFLRLMSQLRRWFPPALVYREWRLNRGLYVLAWLLFLAPTLRDGLNGSLFWWVRTAINSTPYGGGHLITYNSLVTVGLGVGVFWWDRSRGSLLYTLSGPAPRRDVLRVKALFGILTVVSVYLLIWVLTWAAAVAAVGENVPGPLLVDSIAQILVLVALYLTALAAACAAGNPIFAAIGAFLASAVPAFAAMLLTFFYSPAFHGGENLLTLAYPQWVKSTATALHAMSSLTYFTVASQLGWVSLLFFLWFIAWAVGFWWLGRRIFETAQLEHLDSTFVFPRLWYVVLGGVCFIIATVIGHVLTDMRNGYMYLVWFALLFAASWFVLKKFAVWAGERAEQRR